MHAITLAILTAVVTANPSGLEDPAAAARQLSEQIAAGRWADAAATARKLELATAQRAPLVLTDARVTSAPVPGVGMYEPLFENTVRGREFFVYAQVHNHGVRRVHGVYEIHLVNDLIVYDGAGKELQRDEGLELKFTARSPHRDMFVNIGVGSKGLPGGKYRIRLVVRDRVGGKRAQIDATFRIP